MARPRELVDDAVLQTLAAAGLTYEEIAEASTKLTGYPVVRSTVSVHFSRKGWAEPQPSHRIFIPWEVRSEHQRHYALRMLREASRLAQGFPAVTPDGAKRAAAFFGALRAAGMVVAYGPDLVGAFWAVPGRGLTREVLLGEVPEGAVPAQTRALKAAAAGVGVGGGSLWAFTD